MSSLQEAEARAAKIVSQLVPALTAEFIKKPQPRPLTPQEEAIMAACGDVGRAVDHYDGCKFSNGAAERRARIALETSARNLRKLIDLREAKHARK
ncbi:MULTISPECIES: hypothetical protein [unclassified Mesorhizobium]|uniref:hypothetical protein n=1 Tax=unclassified Mesorhizobium TaxID=325217 RepID=UPI0003CE1CA6|nr:MULTISPECIES: hypothetical protein [unclassified Mesorhizobium]ESY48986.1 hypothetical protein X745_27815 [Mesorhizobium sp. LNJC374B00]ESY52776.1 hypothetical protein X744_28785 [Mesorhizobium sp. LNJC372A00]WJI81497.1 hypothetical protein NLY34_01670 [Mesorhizobium sp. C374B]WJI88016.1 hypothetical protein NLY42_04085 [Mesorhizobium sp. C372A]